MFYDSDYALALKLQEEINRNDSPSSQVGGTSYNKKGRENIPPSTSLIDSSWEYIDPTPDIYAMFQQFNKRFFWGKLDSVEVKWSPRMTSCAGVCCYESRAGMCSIRLSAPLLKLRPRKDLVETMLHEMIHAYLFVTHNNRDRDGHGPEFHKHMYRINKEAGTNITVYHSFHDEVKLYQQHWWRCNGLCQKRPPYFGMVRRATNRAPGPNDFWYAEHQSKCGGTFIKVKEPEGFSEKKTKKTNSEGKPKSKLSNQKDITSFIPFNNKGKVLGSNNTLKKNDDDKQSPFFKPAVPPQPSTSGFIQNNVVGFKDLVGSGNNNIKKGSASNINSVHTGNATHSGVVKKNVTDGALMNKGTGTLVITAKGNKSSVDEGNIPKHKPEKEVNNISTFTGKGNVLGGSSAQVSKPPSEKPWLARLDKIEQSTKLQQAQPGASCKMKSNTHSQTLDKFFPKRSNIDGFEKPDFFPKKSKIEGSQKSVSENSHDINKDKNTMRGNSATIHCPVCNDSVTEAYLDEHLDSCVNFAFRDENLVNCPTCGEEIGKSDLSEHLDFCVRFIFSTSQSSISTGMDDDDVVILNDKDDDVVVINDDKDVVVAKDCQSENCFPCPCCMIVIEENLMNQHLDECLSVNFLKESVYSSDVVCL